MTDKILSKIRKLMSTANGTAEGGEHERDTAMRMALNLLAKHNLSMADLEQPTEDRVAETDTYHSTPWMRTVAYGIATLYFCNFFSSQVSGKNKRVYTYVGLEGNVRTAREMTSYVIKSIQTEASARAKSMGIAGDTWPASFRKGAASQIWLRCQQLRAEAEAANAGQASSGTSIVLASLYGTEQAANAQYIQAKLGVTVTAKPMRQHSTDYSGAEAGQHYARNISLAKQVTAAQQTPAKALA